MTSISSSRRTVKRRPRALGLPLALLAAVAAGCAAPGGGDPARLFAEPPASVELTDVPYHPQELLHCGPAALAEMLEHTGVRIDPERLAARLFIPERRGTLQPEMLAQARRHDRVPYVLSPTPDALLQELHGGHPVLVFQNLGVEAWPVWHYAVLVGYDADAENVILRSGTEKRRKRSLEFFMRSWQRGDRWAVVITPPERLPATAEPAAWFHAAVDLEETGRTAAAEAAYRTGRRHWPPETGFHLGLVNLHHAAGDAAAAEAAARRGLEEAASDLGVLWNNLALILAHQSRWDEAESAARAAIAEGGAHADTFRATRARVACRGQRDCLEQLDTEHSD